MKWSVMVTTAPRRDPTLTSCVLSLKDCGWDKEVTVCAEPKSPIEVDCNIHQNPKVLGTWHNWINSVRLALETDAEVIMTVQDDSLFHPDCKEFAEANMWPSPNCGFLSLYTPSHYTVRSGRLLKKLRKKNPDIATLRPVGINHIHTKSMWGACALIFPRKVLEHFIKSPLVDSWIGAPVKSRNPAIYQKRRDNPHLIANSDTAIGKFMNWNKYTMWFVDPSPVQHIAKYSAIGHGGNKGNRNAHRIADHSLPLNFQVFPNEYN